MDLFTIVAKAQLREQLRPRNVFELYKANIQVALQQTSKTYVWLRITRKGRLAAIVPGIFTAYGMIPYANQYDLIRHGVTDTFTYEIEVPK